MIIYADILFVLNLAVDYLLLFAAARIAGAKFARLRALLGAAIGAVYSFIIFFPLSKTVLVFTRFCTVLIMVLVTFGKRKIAEFLRLSVIFYISSFIFSGFMMLINSFLKTQNFFAKNGIVYFEFSPMEIVISAAAAFAVTEVLRRLFRHGEVEGKFIVKIYYGENTAVLKGFTDTGNSLTEPFSGTPVAVAQPKALIKILPEAMLEAMLKKDLSTEYAFRLVPCNTVSGSVLMPAFKPDLVLINNEKGEFEAEELLIGLSEFVPENTLIIGKNVILKEKGKIFSEV